MNNIQIREISLEQIVDIHNKIPEFLSEAQGMQYFTNKLGDEKALFLGAYVDDVPAGYIVAYDKYKDSSLYCWMAGVIPEYRNKGVLSHLMNFLENWAKKHQYDSITIKTRNTRREMLAYLVKNNFLFTRVTPYTTHQENRISLKKYI